MISCSYAALGIILLVFVAILFVGGWLIRRMEEEWRQAKEERDA